MVRGALRVLALGVMLVVCPPGTARAALRSLDAVSENNAIEARQFRLNGRRVAGKWNGESLGGLGLVLVETASDNGHASPTANCYISHIATTAQREALVNAFLAAQGLSARDVASWRIEPSMIRIEASGKTVTIHLGLVS